MGGRSSPAQPLLLLESIEHSNASRSGMVTNLAMMGAGGDPLDWDGPGDSPFRLRRGNLWALIMEIPAARLSSRPSVIKAFRITSKTSSSWLSLKTYSPRLLHAIFRTIGGNTEVLKKTLLGNLCAVFESTRSLFVELN